LLTLGKIDQLMVANVITNEVEEEDSTTCSDGGMMELDDE